jgi:hypothetical protein
MKQVLIAVFGLLLLGGNAFAKTTRLSSDYLDVAFNSRVKFNCGEFSTTNLNGYEYNRADCVSKTGVSIQYFYYSDPTLNNRTRVVIRTGSMFPLFALARDSREFKAKFRYLKESIRNSQKSRFHKETGLYASVTIDQQGFDDSSASFVGRYGVSDAPINLFVSGTISETEISFFANTEI